MRIIIEDTQSTVQAPLSSLVEPATLLDGGAAPGHLLQLLAGMYTPAQTGQAGGLKDAGTPPAWLVEAISKAFEADAARFDIRSPASGEAEPVPDAADGGKAPDLFDE